MAAFNLAPVDAPTAEREPNEYDALVPQVEELRKNGQWASLSFPTEEEANTFKRLFGDAANRANLSRKGGKDVKNDDGSVTIKFTTREKIVRKTKEEIEAERATAEAANADAKPAK